MKIGIDIDEVVVEFMKGYLEYHNKEKGTNYKYDEIFSYRFEDFSNLPKEEIRRLVLGFNDAEKFSNLDFVSGAKESIAYLEDNNKIFFITSRHPGTKHNTVDFFEKNFPKNNFVIYFSGENWGNKKSKSKGEICLDLGIKVMIEDNKDYALDCAKKGIKVFLLDKPWNKNYEKHENLIKVKNWEELIPLLDKEIYENENARIF